MTRLLLPFLSWFSAFLRSRHDLGLELAALRQQVGVLKRRNPRPKLSSWDRPFWLTLRRLWSKWASVLVVVNPETVVRWHRAGFRCYWRFRSRRRPGRPKIAPELRKLIRSMAAENPTWGAPRIHGELLKLGFEIAECTVGRYLARKDSGRNSSKHWLTFLKNHREAIAAMDFFTVPTATCRVLYCFFVISHGRRRILHVNVTQHPTSQWIVQQLREVFPEDSAPKYLVLDRDARFRGEVAAIVECLGSKLIRTGYRSPWQNGVAERWVGSCRRELLDHVIVLNESHLRRLVREYVQYYHEDRIHDALNKETPTGRLVERSRPVPPKSWVRPASAACITATIGKQPPEVHAAPDRCASYPVPSYGVKAMCQDSGRRVGIPFGVCFRRGSRRYDVVGGIQPFSRAGIVLTTHNHSGQ